MNAPSNRQIAFAALAVVVALSLCANLWLSMRVNELQRDTAAIRGDLERAERALQDQIGGPRHRSRRSGSQGSQPATSLAKPGPALPHPPTRKATAGG